LLAETLFERIEDRRSKRIDTHLRENPPRMWISADRAAIRQL